jgi:hypothetical protein
MKNKYPFGACLNEKGLEEFGDIFEDGLIPVLYPISRESQLGEEIKNIYLVNLNLLEKELYEKLIKRLSKKFGAPVDEMDRYFREVGLPLRAELVSCVEIDVRFLI